MRETLPMTPFERRLSQRLDADLSAVLQPFDPAGIAAAARQQHRVRPQRSRIVLLAAAAVLTGALVAVGSGVVRLPWIPAPAVPWRLQGVLEPAGTLQVGSQSPAAVVLRDGRVLVISAAINEGISRAEIFDPSSGVSQAVGQLARKREAPTLVVLGDGRVLVAGGDMERRGDEPTAEIFDPAAGSFSLLDSRPTTIDATTLLLPDGRVLFSGGAQRLDPDDVSKRGISSNAEVFDPASGSFVAVGPMQRPRIWHDLVQLHDGRVLVLGGEVLELLQDDEPFAEVFDPATGTFEGTDRPPFSTHIYDWSVPVGDRLVFLRQPGWGQYPDRSMPMYVTFYDLETGAQQAGPEIAASAGVFDVTKLIPLPDERLLLLGSAKASYGSDDLGVHANGWIGVLDLVSGELREIAVRHSSLGTAIRLPDGRVLLLGGIVRAECPVESGATEPCTKGVSEVEIVR